MNKVLGFLVLILVTMVGGPAIGAGREQHFYPIPVPVIPELVLKARPESGKPLHLAASVTAALGTSQDIRIVFDCSPDLKMEAKEIRVKAMREGESMEFPISITWDPKLITVDSWVRVLVEFSPDYPALLARVNDRQAFPDGFKRQMLVTKVENASKKKERQTRTLDYFPLLEMEDVPLPGK